MHIHSIFKKVKTIVFELIILFNYLLLLTELFHLYLNKLTTKYGKRIVQFFFIYAALLYTIKLEECKKLHFSIHF